VLEYNVDGVSLRHQETRPLPGGRRSVCPTGLCLMPGRLIVRCNTTDIERAHGRIAVVSEEVLSGGGGSLRLGGWRAGEGAFETHRAAGGLVIGPDHAHAVPAHPTGHRDLCWTGWRRLHRWARRQHPPMAARRERLAGSGAPPGRADHTPGRRGDRLGTEHRRAVQARRWPTVLGRCWRDPRRVGRRSPAADVVHPPQRDTPRPRRTPRHPPRPHARGRCEGQRKEATRLHRLLHRLTSARTPPIPRQRHCAARERLAVWRIRAARDLRATLRNTLALRVQVKRALRKRRRDVQLRHRRKLLNRRHHRTNTLPRLASLEADTHRIRHHIRRRRTPTPKIRQIRRAQTR
jgi:hypothetical protein